jgi:phage repressor protein C with HTH and peptisase S24 domain
MSTELTKSGENVALLSPNRRLSAPNAPNMSTKSTFLQVREMLALGQSEMAKRLDISRPYLSELENEHRQPSEALVQKLAQLKEAADATKRSNIPQKRQPVGKGIPIISWARAGEAASFEDMPFDWQELLPSDCPDDDAFGLILEGDSMEPKYVAGDIVVLMPQRQARSNQLVAANIRDQGVVFKMLTVLTSPRRFRLSSYNSDVYQPVEHPERDFQWIYPAYEIRRRVWRQ